MFIDSSAFVALLTDEPDRPRLAARIDMAGERYTSGLVRLETVMRVASKLRVRVAAADQSFDRLLSECAITVVPITDDIAHSAADAFARFGKGRGQKAQLNLSDCMSYAVAHAHRCPILFIGKDFQHTDLTSALDDSSPASA